MLVILGTKRVNVAKAGTLAPGSHNTEQKCLLHRGPGAVI